MLRPVIHSTISQTCLPCFALLRLCFGETGGVSPPVKHVLSHDLLCSRRGLWEAIVQISSPTSKSLKDVPPLLDGKADPPSWSPESCNSNMIQTCPGSRSLPSPTLPRDAAVKSTIFSARVQVFSASSKSLLQIFIQNPRKKDLAPPSPSPACQSTP